MVFTHLVATHDIDNLEILCQVDRGNRGYAKWFWRQSLSDMGHSAWLLRCSFTLALFIKTDERAEQRKKTQQIKNRTTCSCRSSITFSCQNKIKWLDSSLYILRCYFCRQDKHKVGQWDCQASFKLSPRVGLRGNTGKIYVRMFRNSRTQISWTERAKICLQSQ